MESYLLNLVIQCHKLQNLEDTETFGNDSTERFQDWIGQTQEEEKDKKQKKR